MLLRFAAPYRGSLLLCSVFMVADTAAALAVPWLGGTFIADLFSATPEPSPILLFALLALFLAQALFKFASSYVAGNTTSLVLADLRLRIYNHLQSLPLPFHQQRSQGDLLALLTHEVGQLASFITGTLMSLPSTVIAIAGAILIMARISPGLAALVAMLVPVFYLILKILGRKLRPLAQELQQADAAAIAIAGENLTMAETIKAFTRESRETGRYARQLAKVRALSMQELRNYALLEPALQLTAASALVLLLWLAGNQLMQARMNTQELASFLLYAAFLTRPVGMLAEVYGQVLMASGTLARLQSVFQEHPEGSAANASTFTRVQGTIEFEHVVFSYPGRTPAVDDVSLVVRAGETIAITGENGAGKSTLAHLLMRFYEPQGGCIRIDGVDIAGVDLQSLRLQIGVVPQRVHLLDGSIRDNIGFGLDGASDAQIEAAARAAQAHDFICKLPHGYDSVIGDQGVRLSGGQRQRVALARALIKNPPILIFDEATSMFDPESENSFINDAAQVLRDRTVILITHRPASLALAERIVRMSEGRIVQTPEHVA